VVEAEHHLGPRFELVRVPSRRQVARGEVTRAEADRREPAHFEAEPGLIGQREPASVRVVAVLLREDVGDVLIRDRALEAADDGGRQPVRIRLPGAAAVPGKPLEAGLEGEPDPDSRRVAELRRELHDVLDQDLAVVPQPVALTVRDKAVGSMHELDSGAVRARGDDAEVQPVEAELEPARKDSALSARHLRQAVVVGRGPPEL
jgi:hypothetical protein